MTSVRHIFTSKKAPKDIPIILWKSHSIIGIFLNDFSLPWKILYNHKIKQTTELAGIL